jgi:hypothetical protein
MTDSTPSYRALRRLTRPFGTLDISRSPTVMAECKRRRDDPPEPVAVEPTPRPKSPLKEGAEP